MTGSSRNQTRTYLMDRFATLGIHPREKLGQNFLIDLNLVRLLAESARPDENDVVLEVGTGTGSLTHLIAEKAFRIVTVEVDPIMQEMARQELVDFSNVRFLLTDILRNKNCLTASVLEAVKEELNAPIATPSPDQEIQPIRRFKLCANLPYAIATPLLSNLLLCDTPPHSMTVTIQKEVADRIVAKPRSKDYGALSVWMQSICDTHLIRVMPPSVFWPRPKVDSAIIQLTWNQKKRRRIPDLPYFHQFVRSLFLHRRKFLRSVLCSAFKDRLPKSVVDEILADLGINEAIRAEELDGRQILKLCEAFRARKP